MSGGELSGFRPPSVPGPARIAAAQAVVERLDAAAHAADLIDAARGADALWNYMGYGPFPDPAAHRARIAAQATAADAVFYAIRPGDGAPAQGVAAFLRIAPAHGVIEIGHILLTPPLQRTVTATAALSAMIGWAFDAGYRRVEWKCDARNVASRRAALRLGFAPEGTFRQHMIVKGRNRDTAWFAILDRDWPVIRAAHAAWLAPENFGPDGRQRQSLAALTRAAIAGRRDRGVPGAADTARDAVTSRRRRRDGPAPAR